ncbi:MAG TPA: DNRLRE domain-containing protein, partial [Acidimicrobiia bacterium]|nr:DNRLRE domain-containing protein [Acidimicrobiia bacterium]
MSSAPVSKGRTGDRGVKLGVDGPDVLVVANPDGFRVDFEITDGSEVDGPFEIGVEAPRLNLVEDPENGRLVVQNPAGEAVAHISAPEMVDAAGANSESVGLNLVRRGGVTYLVVSPDRDWLQSDDRVFPVIIDPTFWGFSGNDTYALDTCPSCVKGDEPVVRVGTGYDSEKRGFIQFDTSSIPAGAQVDSAVLHLEVESADPGPNTRIAKVLESWQETTLTWSNQPQVGPDLETVEFPSSGTVAINITALAQEWVDDPSSNWGVAFLPVLSGSHDVAFVSTPNYKVVCDPTCRLVVLGIRPTLEIVYDESPPEADTTPPTVTLDQPTEGDIVFHIETLSATAADDVAVDRVEFLVDGAVVGTDLDSPYQLEWDTNSVAEGDHTVQARAFDTADKTAVTVPVTVNVSNELTGAERITTDFDQAVLTVDEYVEYGIWSLHNLDPLPDRYRAGGAFADASTGAAIAFLAYWDQLQIATQDRISAFMSVQEVILPESGGALFQTSSVTWPECNDDNVWLQMFDKVTACKHDVTITAGGPVVFEVHYTVDGEDDPALLVEIQTQAPGITRWSETVEAVDQIFRDGTVLVQCDPIDFGNCNKVPDAIDRIAVSLAQSYVTYETDLGYRPLTALPVDVAVHNTGGQVAPPGLGSLIVEVDNNVELFYLPRHELFHAYQYNYVNLNDLIPDLVLDGESDINWWMEATAEWAAHRVAVAQGPGAPEADRYARPLDAFLGAPQRKLDEWDGFRQPRQYGAFILADYLEERAGSDSIESSWAAMDGYGGNPVQAIEDQLTAIQSDWATELPAFWLANYLLKSPDGTAPYIDGHADTVWRDDLNLEPNLQGETDSRAIALGLDQARPFRDPRRLADGIAESDTVTVERGGASYVDLVPLDSTPGTLRAAVTADTGDPVTVQLQGFSTYPDPCAAPNSFPLAEVAGVLQSETTIPIDANCQ